MESESEDQKTLFYSLLEAHIRSLDDSKRECFCIAQEKYTKIVKALQLNKGQQCPEGAKFKYRCAKHYKLQVVGARTMLCCQKTNCPVVTREELFATIARCHVHVGHGGRDKTWAEIKANYAGVHHSAVSVFLKTCPSCRQRQVVKSLPSGKAMINLSFLLRVQIDLIDFRSRPDRDFKWILHARDCFSKFSWAYPLESKTAAEVAGHLFDQFCTFGPPRLLQSDNGREFTANVIREVCDLWPGTVIIHGRPRHPESQGCIERGNGDLQLKLGKWMDTNGPQWSRGLKSVVHSINTSVSSATGTTPYELVFGQKPRSDQAVWEEFAAQGIVREEDLPNDLLVMLPTMRQEGAVVQSVSEEDAVIESLSQEGAVVESLSQEGAVVESLSQEGAVVQSVSEEDAVVESLSQEGAVVESLSQEGAVVESLSQEGAVVESLNHDGAVVQSVWLDNVGRVVLSQEDTAVSQRSAVVQSGSQSDISCEDDERITVWSEVVFDTVLQPVNNSLPTPGPSTAGADRSSEAVNFQKKLSCQNGSSVCFCNELFRISSCITSTSKH
ncbi:KRAB-A domain-containing protein 2-like [Littorina saxatilis]|uniref:KRAB-A domain-containing protein 2-like n=1 Tax=Littorina saxatilis TaxID=31220 RepID=UPI0038B66BC9